MRTLGFLGVLLAAFSTLMACDDDRPRRAGTERAIESGGGAGGATGKEREVGGDGALTELRALTPSGPCVGQRAAVPAAGTVTAVLTGATDAFKATGDYVALAAAREGALVYFSFQPDLPQHFTTEEARAKLKYAYVGLSHPLPASMGGSVELLSTNQLLHVADFERFEVTAGKLEWALKRTTSTHYIKELTVYDEDPSNDPAEDADCFSGDIDGACVCEFQGPPTQVVFRGSIQLPAEYSEDQRTFDNGAGGTGPSL